MHIAGLGTQQRQVGTSVHRFTCDGVVKKLWSTRRQMIIRWFPWSTPKSM